jgi:hypothetical protein
MDNRTAVMDGGLRYDTNSDGVVSSTDSEDFFDQDGDGIGRDLNADGVILWNTEVDFTESRIPGRLNLNTADGDLLYAALPIADDTQRQMVVARILALRQANNGITTPLELARDLVMQADHPGYNADSLLVSREKMLLLAERLQQVAATRSDVFAVHIVVHGYPLNDFREDPLEARRVLLIVARGTNSAGAAQVLYRHDY